MLRVMLVDDEPSALKVMELILSKLGNVLIAGMYTSGEKALACIEEDRPDAVFVDIEMPGKSGLDVAEELTDKYPEIRVVFVTAHNKYAIEAFDASAMDYLLKPVRKERLEKTLARLEKSGKHKPDHSGGSKGLRIQCFGKFTVYTPSGTPLGWRTRKTEELMAVFVHNRYRELSKDRIIDLLWPEFDAEKAGVLFHTTLYNLKKALGELGGGIELVKTGSGYMLYLHKIDCDIEELEKRLDGLGMVRDGNIGEFEEAVALYTGAYYEENGYQWAEGKRLELQNRLTAVCLDMALYYQGKAQWEKAADALESLLRMDDMYETVYEMLMRCCRKMGNAGRMLQTYDRYRAAMKELNLRPQNLEELCKE